MKHLTYLALAVEFVGQVEDLLVHPGSRQALTFARTTVKSGKADGAWMERARANAFEDVGRCACESSDGRAPAAEAAWQLLAPDIAEWVQPIAENVARAMAAKIVMQRRGAPSLETREEFNYVRAVHLELMMDRIAKLESGNSGG